MKAAKNKKGMEKGLVFLFAMFLIAIQMFVFFQYYKLEREAGAEVILADFDSFKSDTFLSTYLKSESRYGPFSGLLYEAYSKNDFSLLESETTAYLEKIFEKEIGWEMSLNEEEIGEGYSKRKKTLEDSAIIPGPDRQPIKIIIRISG